MGNYLYLKAGDQPKIDDEYNTGDANFPSWIPVETNIWKPVTEKEGRQKGISQINSEPRHYC